MASKELIDYIKQTLDQGFAEEQIRKELLGAGWLLGDVNEAFGSVKSPSQPQAQPSPQIRSPQTSVYPSNQTAQINKSQPAASPISAAKRDPLSSPFLSSTPTTSQPANQFSNTTFNAPKKSKLGLIIAIIAIVVILGGGGAYAYTQKLWFFAPSVSDEQLINNLFANIKEISSVSYNLSLSLETTARDLNIQPVSSTPGINYGDLSFLGNDYKVNLKLSGDSQNQTSTDINIKIGADIKSSSINTAAEVEILGKNSSYYFKLNQLPTIPFLNLNLEKITNKWIKINDKGLNDFYKNIPISIDSIDSLESNLKNNTSSNPSGQLSESFKSFLTQAQTKSLFTFSKPIKEKNGDIDVYHYKLTIDKTKIVPFYQDFTNELKTKFGDNSLLGQNDKILAQFQGPDFDKNFDFLSKNSTFDLWVNPTTALPQKISYVLKVVPDPSNPAAENLKDKQITLSMNLELSNINQPPAIIEPTEFLTDDDLGAAIKDLTKAQYLAQKQINNIFELRSTLSAYKEFTSAYPESLDKLMITGNDILKLNPKSTILKIGKEGSTQYCDYLMMSFSSFSNTFEFLPTSDPNNTCGNIKLTESIPQDVYTKTPYTYTKVGDDYKLTYTITFPVVSTSTATSTANSAEFNLLLKKYKNGTNTATKLWLSQEAKSK